MLRPESERFELYIPPEGIRYADLARQLLTLTSDTLVVPKTTEPKAPLVFDEIGVIIDQGRRKIIGPNGAAKSTPLEYDIVEFLALNANKVESESNIYQWVWGRKNSQSTSGLRTHISNIRSEVFPKAGIPPGTIETVRRKGFVFVSSLTQVD